MSVEYNVNDGRIYLAGDVTGSAIWAVGKWLEDHDEGIPYEIFALGGDFGYRFTVERIPNPWIDDPEAYDEEVPW